MVEEKLCREERKEARTRCVKRTEELRPESPRTCTDRSMLVRDTGDRARKFSSGGGSERREKRNRGGRTPLRGPLPVELASLREPAQWAALVFLARASEVKAAVRDEDGRG